MLSNWYAILGQGVNWSRWTWLKHAAGPRLELPFLDSTVQSLTTAGISWTTLTSGLSHFQWFCQHNGLLPFPLSESTLCQFVARLFNDHLTIGSVRLYLSGLQFFQITQGGVDFSVLMMPQLCYMYVLRDFSWLQSECSCPSHLLVT